MILAILTSVLLTGCGSDEPDNPNEITEFTPSQELVMYIVDGITISSQSSDVTIEFTTNKSWTIRVNDSWCHISPSSGKKGTVQVTINVDDNPNSEDRETIITINTAEIDKYIKLTQNGKATFNVTTKSPETLSSYLGDNYLGIKNLTVTGPIGGKDIELLQEMTFLSYLNLSNAHIIGGSTYNFPGVGKTQTESNIITEWMFFGLPNLQELYLPNDVNIIRCYGVVVLPKLKILILPEKLMIIEDYGLFSCPEVESLILPEGFQEFGVGALSGFNRLTSLTLPKSMKRIGTRAFECKDMKEIHCLSEEPPVCWRFNYENINNAFYRGSMVIQNGTTLYVPQNSLEKYKADEPGWGQFKTIIAE